MTKRDIFELYFIEGFDPDEIAMVTPQPLKIAQENIASIQHRLRGEMLDEILAALEFPALDSKAFCRIDELAYRKGGSSRHGRA